MAYGKFTWQLNPLPVLQYAADMWNYSSKHLSIFKVFVCCLSGKVESLNLLNNVSVFG
jgi:hypothetical protein